MRPIRLLNSDLKILFKLLAKRLESVLPGLTMEDQNELMIGHQGFYNPRRVLNIFHDQRGASDTAFLQLGAEKAEWNGFIYLKYLDALVWGRVFVTGLNLCAMIPMH